LKKHICIHGHFYQPPRENAWLEVIEIQDSAHPYHDWNERISAECYAPNTASRILNGGGVIKNIVNNYSKISFNYGPTLLSWMEVNDPTTYNAILDADKESARHFSGHGSAMAQVYNHMILPLANDRDKETQIIWGIKDFEFRFGRKPEGMWLAETAVDLKSLDLLAKHGIRFTVLAPRQAHSIRKLGATDWQDVTTESLDTKRAYKCVLPTGREIALFFYDGRISQGVAFDGLLYDGNKFANRLLGSFDPEEDGPQLVHIATDGETYGHHHKHGDMALAFCIDHIARLKDVTLTNYPEYLEKFPPEYEALIHENSSWSCVHGIERWRDNCGCNSGKPDWHQLWRKPLREALDWLRDEVARIYEEKSRDIIRDPWKARDEYINVILSRNESTIEEFLRNHCIEGVEQNRVFRLMEVQRNVLLMYTSCGWFFDEISGIETVQILQYACRAMQLLSQTSDINLEQEFLKRIELAPSNVPSLENGAEVYRKFVLPSKTNLQRVGMHYAVASIFEEDPESTPVFNYTTSNDVFVRKEAGELKMVLGVTKVKSIVTLSEKRFAFAAIYMGQHNIIGNISLEMEDEKFAAAHDRLVQAFDEARLADILALMQNSFGGEKYTIWQLFRDEKRKVFNLITYQSMRDMESSLRRIYNRDYPLIMALANSDTPIPSAYRTTFAYVLNEDLVRAFESERMNVAQIERIMGDLVKWRLALEDTGKLERLAGESIFREVRRITVEGDNYKRIQRLNRVFPLLLKFSLHPNLYKSQNLYFEMASANRNHQGHSPEWISHFIALGDHLRVKLE